MPFTETVQDQFLNVLRGTNITAPTALSAALFTSGGEVSAGNGYERKTGITFDAPATVDGNRVVAVAADHEFAEPTGAWGTITEVRFVDGDSKVWAQVTLDTPIEITGASDIFRLKAGTAVGFAG